MGSNEHILFVDDNPGDMVLVREALSESGHGTQLHTVPSGEEALKFLRAQAPYDSAPKPKVVLLDLNMPRKNGIQTLQEIRNDHELKSLPVIIFSSSTAPRDHQQANAHQADAYIIKPHNFHEFMQVVRNIETNWCIAKPLDNAGAV